MHYITSLVEKDNQKVLTDLPADFAGMGGDVNENSYACRLEIEWEVVNSEGNKEKVPHFVYDYTCSLFKLDNFQQGGTKTLNLPLNTDSSMLIRNKAQIDGTDQQLLRLNKKFIKSFPVGTSKLSIVDKETTSKTYMELKLDFAFNLSDAKSIRTNLVSAWLQEKINRDTTADDSITGKTFYCELAFSGGKRPCKIYKYSSAQKTQKFNSETLKTLSPIASYDSDVKEEQYYVVDLMGVKKTFTEMANLEIHVYEKEANNVMRLIMTFHYDKPLFGKYIEQGKHKLYFQTPEKRVYLAKKLHSAEYEKLTNPTFYANSTKNYKCRLVGNTTSTPTTIDNLDSSCELFDLPSVTGEQKSIVLTADSFKALNTQTKSIDDNELFKLEVDSTALFNLNPDITTLPHQKIKIMSSDKASSDNGKKHFMQLELIQEFKGVPEKLEGNVQYLLVQARHSTKDFDPTSKTIKCKFYETDEGFDCDMYVPKKQATNLISVGAVEGIENIDLVAATKETFKIKKQFRQKHHFIIDLRRPVPMQELLQKRKLFYVYLHPTDTNDKLPGKPDDEANNSQASGTPNTTQTTKTPPTNLCKVIHFNIVKWLDGDPKTVKPMVFLN